MRFKVVWPRYSLGLMKHYWFSAVASFALLFTTQAQTNAPLEWGPGLKVLILGGGQWHDFETWDNKFDTDVLHKAGITSTHYTEDAAVVESELPHVDVLLLSGNRHMFDTPPLMQAVTKYVDGGGSLVLLHSGTWYTWGGWPNFNKLWVGGGAHEHDGPGPFTETIIKDHPVTQGLPKTFQITDEFYHITPDPNGSPIEVLIEGSKPDGRKYPSVWLTHYNKNRIVCIALGHDGFPRSSPNFSTLLVNAVKWAGGQ